KDKNGVQCHLAARYSPKAKTRQGPTRRVCSTGQGFRSRRACLLLFTRIVSRVDVIDRPRPNAMDLKDGLFLGPGEVVHLRLHNRHAAGRYSLGLGGIKLVSHADVKGAGDHSYVLDRGVRVRRNFEVRWELNAEGERHCLIQGSLNDGKLRAGGQRWDVSPFKIGRRNKRVSLSRICWRDQEDAKSAQKCGCYCNAFHSFLLGCPKFAGRRRHFALRLTDGLRRVSLLSRQSP